MSAISELFIILIYIVLGGVLLIALIFTLVVKRPYKYFTAIVAAFFAILLVLFAYNQRANYQENQMGKVGVYYLTDYPNCATCHLILSENMTFTVVSGKKIIETGDWHYEQGGDYFITYLNNDRNQLGAGNYRYGDYKLKYEIE